jgi:5'-nucleotidase/UDP-sugar diphosphatase
MSNLRKFTILHSNDMHGDFLAEAGGDCEGKMVGGLALLSGYVNQVRAQEDNVIFAIAGDMVQGSLIDSEYKGISTIEIMNYLAPDVVTLGNHEFDYGLPHLLFLEKMANFPVVNANLYIRKYSKRLMRPYLILPMAGLHVMFIGIITEKVIDALRSDPQISAFVSLEEAASEVGKITAAYKNEDIDLTILLTHIGFESDCELAAMLDPAWGVDMIIGGHSHTVLEEPAVVNDILITQAGVGTDQIGRYDIVVDDDTNSIVEYAWQLIPITCDLAEPDHDLEAYIQGYKAEVDRKYNALLCKMGRELTHPRREEETSLGNLFADAVADAEGFDVMLLGSGSIRGQRLGPVVTRGNFISIFPYNDSLTRFTVTGEQLTRMVGQFMRPENRNGEGEYYQVNGAVRAVYSEAESRLLSLEIHGQPVDPAAHYRVGMQGYHAKNAGIYLGVSPEEMAQNAPPKVVSTSTQDVLLEWLQTHQNVTRSVEGRLRYV